MYNVVQGIHASYDSDNSRQLTIVCKLLKVSPYDPIIDISSPHYDGMPAVTHGKTLQDTLFKILVRTVSLLNNHSFLEQILDPSLTLSLCHTIAPLSLGCVALGVPALPLAQKSFPRTMTCPVPTYMK